MYWIFDFLIHLQCRMYVWLRSTPTIYAASGRLVEMIYTKIQFLLHFLLYIASEMRCTATQWTSCVFSAQEGAFFLLQFIKNTRWNN